MIFWKIAYAYGDGRKGDGWQVLNGQRETVGLFDADGAPLEGGFDYAFLEEVSEQPSWWKD